MKWYVNAAYFRQQLGFPTNSPLTIIFSRVPTILAVGSIGLGVSAYRSIQAEMFSTQSAEMERLEIERRRRDAVLMDSYGGKSSLEDLEKAVALYESQRKN